MVCDEVVVQAGEICAATVDELDGRLHIDAQGATAFNGIEDVLLCLLQQLLLNRQVLDDGGRIVDAGRGRDIVERGVVGEGACRRRGQESGVRVAKRHDAGISVCWLLIAVVYI